MHDPGTRLVVERLGEHRRAEVGERARHVLLDRKAQLGELVELQQAVRPVRALEIGRPLRDHDLRRDPMHAELTEVLPGHDRSHRPPDEHRVLESELLEHVVDVARVLGDGMPVVARGRSPVAAEIERDHAVTVRQRSELLAEEIGRHADPVQQHERSTASLSS